MINTRAGIRALKRGLLAVFFVFSVSAVTQAGPLGVPVDPIPSLIAGFINSSYNATTGSFTATGFASSLDKGTGKLAVSGSFNFAATIDNTGVASNATIRVGTAAAPTLFSTSLIPGGFAFNPIAGGSLEFLFGVVSGSYVTSGIYSATKPLDVLFTGMGAAFPGTFTTTWSSSNNIAEIREDPPIDNPEPSSLLVILAGAGGLSRYLRKRNLSKRLA